MNIFKINSPEVKTNILSSKNKLLLKSLYQTNKSTTDNLNNVLQNTNIYILPFTVKIKFVQTIKSCIPTITYMYISPSMRFIKSYKYQEFINKNSTSTEINISNIYTNLLKI